MKTAEEFLLEKQKELGYNPSINIKRASICLQEFAKLHVTETLKAASKTKVEGQYSSQMFSRTNKDEQSILNSYPLSNIK